MNLKDAFRLQNTIQGFIGEAIEVLEDRRNILKVTTTYLRSRAVADAEDVTLQEIAPSEYAGHANEVVDLLLLLLEEKEKLTAAITKAKRGLPIDMDGEVSLNQQRQRLSTLLRRMNAYQSGEKIIPQGGSGFRFNGEGNQIKYLCDARQVTTIDFKRDKFHSIAVSLSRKADGVSAQLDRCLVNTEVAYTPPFDANDTFQEVLSAYIEKCAQATAG